MKEKYKLEEISDIIMGQSPSSDTYNSNGDGLPFFQGKSEFGEVFPTAVVWCSTPQKIAEAGDILISVRAPVGPTNLVKEKCCIGRGLAAIRPNLNKIDRDFLLLQLKYLESDLVKKGQGSTFEAIGTKELEGLMIFTPEFTQQIQISSLLKTQLAEVDMARKALEVQLSEIKSLSDALITKSILEGKSIKVKLGQVISEVKKGIGETWQDFPVMGATRKGLAPAKEPPGKSPQRYKPVFPGTVFYNPMRILIGSIAFVDQDDSPGITSPDYVVLQGKEGVVDSRWFYYWLRSTFGEMCIKSLARGAVRERMLFNRLAEGIIDLPAFSVQQNISDSLKELRSVYLQISNEIEELNRIPGKLLEKAFTLE